jgi:hypothetical protein
LQFWQLSSPLQAPNAKNAELDKRNKGHEKPIRAESEVRDILFAAERDNISFVWEDMTMTEFKVYYSALKNYSVEQIGKALKKSGHEAVNKYRGSKKERLAKLPRPKNKIEPDDFKSKF